jgi:hypothetical protein
MFRIPTDLAPSGTPPAPLDSRTGIICWCPSCQPSWVHNSRQCVTRPSTLQHAELTAGDRAGWLQAVSNTGPTRWPASNRGSSMAVATGVPSPKRRPRWITPIRHGRSLPANPGNRPFVMRPRSNRLFLRWMAPWALGAWTPDADHDWLMHPFWELFCFPANLPR